MGNYKFESKDITLGDGFKERFAELQTLVKLSISRSPEVTSKKGIFEYILSGNEQFLNLRQFDKDTKQEVFDEQYGKCKHCGVELYIDEHAYDQAGGTNKDLIAEADHKHSWKEGGKTEKSNCQILCRVCNRRKSAKSISY